MLKCTVLVYHISFTVNLNGPASQASPAHSHGEEKDAEPGTCDSSPANKCADETSTDVEQPTAVKKNMNCTIVFHDRPQSVDDVCTYKSQWEPSLGEFTFFTRLDLINCQLTIHL